MPLVPDRSGACDYTRFRRWRHESGLTPEQVCAAAHVSYSYYRRVEDGKAARPSASVTGRLLEVFGKTLADLHV